MLFLVGVPLLLVLLLVLLKRGGGGKLPKIDTTPISEEVLNKWPRYDLPRRCLVTGGCGFLGSNLVDALLLQGVEVTVLDIRDNNDSRVKFIKADLRDAAQVSAAVRGVDCIFHTASPDPFTRNTQLLFDVNVKGTQNLLDACKEHGVKRFVFTSSASVVFSGSDQKGVDESVPVPATFRDAYSKSKAMADQSVLAFNGDGGVRTCSVRPHGLFGPRDPQFFPTLIANARKGKTKMQIGNGANVVDFTYIGNVVHSHLLAAERLSADDAACAGKPYFITNNEPLPFWDFMGMVLQGLGYPKPSIKLPYALCLFLAKVTELGVKLLSPIKQINTVFTPSKVQIAGTHHYYSTAAAARDLGYQPLWTLQEGLAISLLAFPELRNEAADLAMPKPQGPFTAAEVARHDKKGDVWLIIDDKVYDMTPFDDHPGGEDAILEHAGGDATVGFHGDQHPPTVHDWLPRFYIGDLAK